MLAVQYLTTRVNKLTRGDWQKAFRILEYLNGTIEIGLTLRVGTDWHIIKLYADASYGIHDDGMSHSAGIVTVGKASVSKII